MSDLTTDDVIQHQVEVWRKLIISLVDGKELVSYLCPEFITSEQKNIVRGKNSRPEATEMLLQFLENGNQSGRWTSFIYALEAKGYLPMLNTLNVNTDYHTETEELQRRLIDIFAVQIEEVIDAVDISRHLVPSQTLSFSDVDQIESAARSNGRTYGVWKMLELLPIRNSNWFDTFLDVLYENGYKDLTFIIDDSYEKKKLIQEDSCASRPLREQEQIDVKNQKQINKSDEKTILYRRESEESDEEEQFFDAVSSQTLIGNLNETIEDITEKFDSSTKLQKGGHLEEIYNSKEETFQKQNCSTEQYRAEEGVLISDLTHQKETTDDIKERNIPEHDDDEDNLVVTVEHKKRNLNAELRKYQLELAEIGEKGKNCIIIAPTNTGKTHVALKIIQERLNVNDIKKTVFVVPTNILAKQQGAQCQEYLQCQSGYTSREKQQTEIEQMQNVTSIGTFFKENEVVVLTAQLLLNALNTQEVSLHDLGLIIFDECHHTNEKHPYNQIMLHYLEKKLEGPNTPDEQNLPQIIGLTASPGVGGAKEEYKAKQWIKIFMCNMDADYLVTVKKHVDEMECFANIPVQDIIETNQRIDTSFGDKLSTLCSFIATQMKEKAGIYAKNFKHNPGTEPFTMELSEYFDTLTSIPDEQAHLYQEMRIMLKVLKIYNESLMIYKEARVRDALQFIEVAMEDEIHEKEDQFPIISKIRLWFKDCNFANISDSEPAFINPKLETLKKIVIDQFASNTDSRVLIFVKTLNLLNRMLSWMKDIPKLQIHNPVKIAGSQEQTKASALQNIKSFGLGTSKIAVATSVAEEGIDIQHCNLVVLYDHVTNEIARVQKKGRSRQTKSRYILVTTKGGAAKFKEHENIMKEKMMENAIKCVQGEIDEKPDEFLKYKQEYQRKCVNDLRMEKETLPFHQHTNGKKYDFLCQCRRYLTSTDDIRKIGGVHHICINNEIMATTSIRGNITIKHRGKSSDMYKGDFVCKFCGNKLGGVIKHKKLWFPLLAIKNVLVKGLDSLCKKWVDLPSANIKIFDGDDLIQIINSNKMFLFDEFEENS